MAQRSAGRRRTARSRSPAATEQRCDGAAQEPRWSSSTSAFSPSRAKSVVPLFVHTSAQPPRQRLERRIAPAAFLRGHDTWLDW